MYEAIQHHFLSLWYDFNWNWTLVSRAIGEHSTKLTNEPVYLYKYALILSLNKTVGLSLTSHLRTSLTSN